MDTNQFKGNVIKTLSQKPARAGLRHLAGNQVRTNIAHCITGFADEVSELFGAMRGYILGEQFSDQMRKDATEEFGDIAYFLVTLAKQLKVKVPSAGKKLKLEGTRLAAMLDLQADAQYMLDLQKKYYYGVQTKDEPYEAGVRKLKGVDTPYPAGTRKVLDKDAQRDYDEAFQKKIAERLPQALDKFQRLVFDTLQQPLGFIFDTEMAKLQVRYPNGEFDMRSQEERKADREKAALEKKAAEATAGTTPATPVVQPTETATA